MAKIKWDCFQGEKNERTWLLTLGLYIKAATKTDAEAQVHEIVKQLKYGGSWHFTVKPVEES